MSRKPFTDLEHSSEITTWIVLICSGLALVVFFGWIAKDMSMLVFPDQAKSMPVQTLSETGSASDTSADAIKLVDNQAIYRVPSGNNLSSKSDKGSAEPKGSSAPGFARESAAQSTQRIVAETLKSRQTSTGQAQQFARQKDGERNSNQRHAAESPAIDRNSQREAPEEDEITAHASGPQSETTPNHPDKSTEAPLDPVPTDPVRTAAIQEAVILTDQVSATEQGSAKELSGQARDVVLPPNSTVQTNTAEQTTGSSLNNAPSQTQAPSADLGALRELLAEAAAFNETEYEQVRAERERGDDLESLSILSAAIQFAPGSKVASESVTSTLNKIQRILADYPETTINVVVATNESGNQKRDMLLSQERGRTLIARLVNNGLAFSRFSLTAVTDDQLPVNTHRVEIQAHAKS